MFVFSILLVGAASWQFVSMTTFEHFNSSNMTAHAFAQITWTVTADFVKIVYADGISSVVSNNIIDALA
jgi:hypothetical protein